MTVVQRRGRIWSVSPSAQRSAASGFVLRASKGRTAIRDAIGAALQGQYVSPASQSAGGEQDRSCRGQGRAFGCGASLVALSA